MMRSRNVDPANGLTRQEIIEVLGAMALEFHNGAWEPPEVRSLEKPHAEMRRFYGVSGEEEFQDLWLVRGECQGLSGRLRDFLPDANASIPDLRWPVAHAATACPSDLCAATNWVEYLEKLVSLWLDYTARVTRRRDDMRIDIGARLPTQVVASLIRRFPNAGIRSSSAPPENQPPKVGWSLPISAYVEIGQELSRQLFAVLPDRASQQ